MFTARHSSAAHRPSSPTHCPTCAVNGTIPSPCHGHILPSRTATSCPQSCWSCPAGWHHHCSIHTSPCSAGHCSLGLDPSACAPAGSSWGCWGTRTHESMCKDPLSGMYKCIPYSTGGKCCMIWPCPTARPRLIKQGCSGQGVSESLPADRMQPGQISATLMSHSRKADAAQPERARLSPPPLPEPWQAAATDCCSKGRVPCPPPLPSTALPRCGGVPHGSPQPQATPPQPGTLPAAPGTATASGSPAQP